MANERLPAAGAAALLGVTVALGAARLYAATRVGFGDSEALYAAYALHPQPAYLDHPGLIGAAARWIGGGTSPGPERAHLVTALGATLLPWLMALACRASGATWRRALVAALVFSLVPEVAVGLFAMTPDLLLALAWTSALACAARALRSAPDSAGAAAGFAGAGVLAGVATASKVTGVLLFAGIAVAYALPGARRHARTLAPWAGLAAGVVVLAPVVGFEARLGWPMIHHRLVDSQPGAGLSLRNVAALVGGQFAYLSPLVAVLAARAAGDAWRGRSDAVGGLLLACSAGPLAVLTLLCLWSRVAEPHWIAPGLIALVPVAARAPRMPSRRLVTWSCAVAGTLVALAHAWVLVPSLMRLAGNGYDARFDIANELYGWPAAIAAVREEASAMAVPGGSPEDVTVVGPHWVICAQLAAALRHTLPVGCDTPIRDDFDDWAPRDRWRRSDVIIWVNDTRFPDAAAPATHAILKTRSVPVFRDGRVVRLFTIAVLTRRAQALR